MRILVALSFVLAACGAPKKAPLNETNDTAVETCCCKSHPMTSEDGSPAYESTNRMECSSKQGECVDEIQCVNNKPSSELSSEPSSESSSDVPPPAAVE